MQVEVSVELVEVSQIVDRDQKFEVEFYVYYSWHDPRFAFDPQQEGTKRKLINADDVWNPDPQLLDELDVNVRGGHIVHAYPDGKLCFSRYYRGTIAGSLDLHEFPLDTHTLEVDLEESVFEADQVVFVPGEVRALKPEQAVPHGWKLTKLSSEAKTSVYSRTGEHYSMLRLKLDVARDPHYYFWAIVLPLIPIVATAWSVFWMNPKEFSAQASVGITAMLTIVAYRISIDSSSAAAELHDAHGFLFAGLSGIRVRRIHRRGRDPYSAHARYGGDAGRGGAQSRRPVAGCRRFCCWRPRCC